MIAGTLVRKCSVCSVPVAHLVPIKKDNYSLVPLDNYGRHKYSYRCKEHASIDTDCQRALVKRSK